MLKKILLGLCLVPALAYAEITCLEGPSGGGCHSVDPNGEIFKTASSTAKKQPTVKRAVKTNTQTATANTTQKPTATSRRAFRVNTAEQRIRLRAQMVENRFNQKQGTLNTDDATQRKQAAEKLRNRIETQ